MPHGAELQAKQCPQNGAVANNEDKPAPAIPGGETGQDGGSQTPPSSPRVTTLKLTEITCDTKIQSRVELNSKTVRKYAERMAKKVHFPPLTVFCVDGQYWIADGFHRYAAAQKANLEAINVEIWQGTLEEAIWHAVGANATPGLRRTNADKLKAVQMALECKQGRSNREIAEHCGVSHTMVAKIRAQLATVASCSERIGLDGKRRKLPQPRSSGQEDQQPTPMEDPAHQAETANQQTAAPRGGLYDINELDITSAIVERSETPDPEKLWRAIECSLVTHLNQCPPDHYTWLVQKLDEFVNKLFSSTGTEGV